MGTQNFEVLDTVDNGTVETVKCGRFVRDGVIRTIYEERLHSLKWQSRDAMRSELVPITQWGFLGEVIPTGLHGTSMKFSMQRLSISYFIRLGVLIKLRVETHTFEVLVHNQATLHVFQDEALVSNIWPNGKARNIGGINGSQSGMR